MSSNPSNQHANPVNTYITTYSVFFQNVHNIGVAIGSVCKFVQQSNFDVYYAARLAATTCVVSLTGLSQINYVVTVVGVATPYPAGQYSIIHD